MCGIVGVVPNRDRDPAWLGQIVNKMADAIVHRGPDDGGFFVRPNIALGMRRLSIVDVANGQQPMVSASGSKVLVFNGELYNYRALRTQLEAEGVQFKTASDTEVVLEVCDTWGRDAVSRLEGMFGFALWDDRSRTLQLTRDWVGQKSIYFAETQVGLIFGSEVKAILASGLVQRELDVHAMSHYMSMRYLPGDSTFFADIKKVPASHTLSVSASDRSLTCNWIRRYQPKYKASEAELLDELDDILAQVVSEHLMSEVPIGAFLSGGIDSSLVVAYASNAMSDPLSTFSVGVDESTQSELPWARQVAERYATKHMEAVAKPNLARIAPKVVHAMEEPADPLAFGNYIVSEIAAEHITVALGGDGGDEIFAGYDRYKGQQLAELYAYLPSVLRRNFIRPLMKAIPESYGYNSFATKLRWLDKMADSKGFVRYADSAAFLRFPHQEKSRLLTEDVWRTVANERSEELLRQYFEDGSAEAFVDKMLYADLSTRMADHQLPIVDKMSMAHSLEVRSPFLDRRVVNFAASIPANLQMKERRLKYIPRKLGERYLSRDLLYRKKQGFGFPLALWFRSSLKTLIEWVVEDSRLVEAGIFRREAMRHYVNEHLRGIADHNYRLWMLFTMELFYRHYIEGAPLEDLDQWVEKGLTV